LLNASFLSAQAMQMAGIEGKQVVLLLEDHQFVDQQFLELVNSLLSAGEVPGLYTHEELEPLLAPIKDQASEAGFRGTIVQYFASSMYMKMLIHLLTDITL
jgi:dynein heavy chain 2, cytosolic